MTSAPRDSVRAIVAALRSADFDRSAWVGLITTLALTLLAAQSLALTPLALKFAVNHAEEATDRGYALFSLLAFAGLHLLARVLNELKWVAFARPDQRLQRILAVSAFGSLLRATTRAQESQTSGAWIDRLSKGSMAVRALMFNLVFYFLPALLEVALTSFVLLWQFRQTTFVALILVAFGYVTIMLKGADWLRKPQVEMQGVSIKAQAVASDYLIAMQTVKVTQSEESAVARFCAALEMRDQIATRFLERRSTIGLVQSLWIMGGLAVVLGAGLANSELGAGSVAMLCAAFFQILRPLENLSLTYREIHQALDGISGMLVLNRVEPEDHSEVQTGPAMTNPTLGQGAGAAIQLSKVSFGFAGKSLLLKDAELSIGSGEFVVLQGPSGCGKSTLAKLLMRFYEPDAGEIQLDGISIRVRSHRELRSQIAYVNQETGLINGSLRDNLLLGRVNRVDDELASAELEAAALDAAMDAAQLREWVASLPQGLDTQIGDRGLAISGGERQRICVARALLRKAPLLILDEATSALDAVAERELLTQLRTAARDSTILFISHRPAPIEFADRIINVSADGQYR